MSQSKIYVGNLSYETTQDDLNGLFAQYGSVAEVRLISDRETGRSKGFAFVTFDDSQGVHAAIEAVNGSEFQGRRLKVNEAKEDNRRERR